MSGRVGRSRRSREYTSPTRMAAVDGFEYEGVLWLADEPSRQAVGRLTYKPTESASLDLLGSLGEEVQALQTMNGTGPGRRIVSAAARKTRNTDRCGTADTRSHSPRAPR